MTTTAKATTTETTGRTGQKTITLTLRELDQLLKDTHGINGEGVTINHTMVSGQNPAQSLVEGKKLVMICGKSFFPRAYQPDGSIDSPTARHCTACTAASTLIAAARSRS